MLGRFKDCSIIAGCLIESEVTISFTNAGGADAVSAMNGALLKALRLPILLKASRKLEPLLKRRKKLLSNALYLNNSLYIIPTIHKYSGPHPPLPRPGAVLLLNNKIYHAKVMMWQFLETSSLKRKVQYIKGL